MKTYTIFSEEIKLKTKIIHSFILDKHYGIYLLFTDLNFENLHYDWENRENIFFQQVGFLIQRTEKGKNTKEKKELAYEWMQIYMEDRKSRLINYTGYLLEYMDDIIKEKIEFNSTVDLIKLAQTRFYEEFITKILNYL